MPPASDEIVLRQQFRGRDIDGERLRPDLALSVVVVGEVDERRLDVIAKAAAFRRGPAEVAAQKPDGELLAQIGGRVGIADRARR